MPQYIGAGDSCLSIEMYREAERVAPWAVVPETCILIGSSPWSVASGSALKERLLLDAWSGTAARVPAEIAHVIFESAICLEEA